MNPLAFFFFDLYVLAFCPNILQWRHKTRPGQLGRGVDCHDLLRTYGVMIGAMIYGARPGRVTLDLGLILNLATYNPFFLL